MEQWIRGSWHWGNRTVGAPLQAVCHSPQWRFQAEGALQRESFLRSTHVPSGQTWTACDLPYIAGIAQTHLASGPLAMRHGPSAVARCTTPLAGDSRRVAFLASSLAVPMEEGEKKGKGEKNGWRVVACWFLCDASSTRFRERGCASDLKLTKMRRGLSVRLTREPSPGRIRVWLDRENCIVTMVGEWGPATERIIMRVLKGSHECVRGRVELCSAVPGDQLERVLAGHCCRRR